jgi:hypothetical protein
MADKGSGLRFGEEAVEQLVLRLLETGDLIEHLGAMALHRVGVALGVLVLAVSDRGLGHEGSQTSVIGGLGQVSELLLGHRQLLPKLAQAGAELREASLDEGP